MRRSIALGIVTFVAIGCDSMAPSMYDGGGAADAAADDPDPIFSPQERAALATLRYDDGPPPIDPSNRVADDPAARIFGQRLFFDRSLSGPLIESDNDGTEGTLGLRGEAGRVSCAGCHVPEDGFLDSRSRGQQVSLGAQWTLRRSPSLLEVGFASLYNWDGRRDSIWGQAIGVMESDHEFNSGRLFVAEQIFREHREEYEAVFGRPMPALDDPGRFPQLAPEEAGCTLTYSGTDVRVDCRGKPGDDADYDAMAEADQRIVTEITVNVAKALAAYVRSLRCGSGRFDAWLDGEPVLSRAEQRGAALFAGRARCIECHSGPMLSDSLFHNVGLQPQTVAIVILDANDRGAVEGIAAAIDDPLNTRGELSDGDRGHLPQSVGPELEGAFRTPSLRCVASRPSFMHTGHVRTLDQVVAFFARGGDHGGYPGTNELSRLDLSVREQADLVQFLGALSGPGPDAALLARP